MNNDAWQVDAVDEFLAEVHDVVLASGIRNPFSVAHSLKTTLWIESELNTASHQTLASLLAMLNRLVNSPIKQKNIRGVLPI